MPRLSRQNFIFCPSIAVDPISEIRGNRENIEKCGRRLSGPQAKTYHDVMDHPGPKTMGGLSGDCVSPSKKLSTSYLGFLCSEQ